MSRLKGKVAIVTGGSKGIGAAIAKSLAAAGASVVVNYASAKEHADLVVAAITDNNGKAIAVKADVTKGSDVKKLFAAANVAFGTVDILVNNAGVYAFGPLASITEEEYRRQFDTNVLSVILATQEFEKQYQSGGASVINIATAGISMNSPMTSLYAATKTAVASITTTLSKELAPKKIRVNAIAPGVIETEGLHTLGVIGTDMETHFVSQTPLGRMGQPDDIASVAVFLAGEDSKWMTGDVLFVSGGMR
jgi:3-oxoacyl-[acyl-carrier protein] reductase